MNVYDQLLMEFPGIETTLTSYSSECHATMLLPSLKQALTNYDKERALYCLGEMDNWYQKNLSKIYSNSYVFHKDEHLRVAELIHLSIQKFPNQKLPLNQLLSEMKIHLIQRSQSSFESLLL